MTRRGQRDNAGLSVEKKREIEIGRDGEKERSRDRVRDQKERGIELERDIESESG